MRDRCGIWHFAVVAGILTLSVGAWSDSHELAAPSGDPNIISKNARVEVLFDGAFFTEGPAVAPCLLYTSPSPRDRG